MSGYDCNFAERSDPDHSMMPKLVYFAWRYINPGPVSQGWRQNQSPFLKWMPFKRDIMVMYKSDDEWQQAIVNSLWRKCVFTHVLKPTCVAFVWWNLTAVTLYLHQMKCMIVLAMIETMMTISILLFLIEKQKNKKQNRGLFNSV